MNIGIIDAEIIGKRKHRFPNLCSMKISAYHKSIGDNVTLLLDYDHLDDYDKVYISKVFIKTNLPNEPKNADKTEENCHIYYKDNPILNRPNVIYGGTGFFYDKANFLPDDIEHIMPDYHLYDEWVNDMIAKGIKPIEFKYYMEYSIGYLTRGCFRQCPFCVNRRYERAYRSNPLYEFYDPKRKKICFLDDNFFSCPKWKEIIQEVKLTNRPFQFNQGLDERLLTISHIKEMVTWKYDGDLTFAFDNYEDKDIIEDKLRMLYDFTPDYRRQIKFYVFCGYDRNGIYDDKFWLDDIIRTFERCYILAKYSALPYLTRHENYKNSPYKGLYTTMARWINHTQFYKSMSFYTCCCTLGMGKYYKDWKKDIEGWINSPAPKYSSYRYMTDFKKAHKDIADKYFYIQPKELSEYGIWK